MAAALHQLQETQETQELAAAPYMARRPPAFVKNPCRARHLNIADGIYPRESMADETLDALSHWLRQNVDVSGGRTYAGGLTKYEPREIERILVPPPERLHDRTTTLDRREAGEDVLAARAQVAQVRSWERAGGRCAAEVRVVASAAGQVPFLERAGGCAGKARGRG